MALSRRNSGSESKAVALGWLRGWLSAVAEFHARSWSSYEHGAQYSSTSRSATSCEWNRCIAMPRGAAISVQFHDFGWITEATDYIDKLRTELPSCVVHGNLNLEYLCESVDGGITLTDSKPGRDAAMVEVAYFITSALDPSWRRNQDATLVNHYRCELTRFGIDAPCLDELLYQFAVFLPIGLQLNIIRSTERHSEAFITEHTARFSTAMLDHNTKEIIDFDSRRYLGNGTETVPVPRGDTLF